MATIITKNSATPSQVPSSLTQGELAINVTDGKLYYGSGSGNVVKEFTGSGGSSTPTFPYTGSAIISGSLTITGSFYVSNSIDSNSRYLIDSNNTVTVDWENTLFNDSSGNASVNVTNRRLQDSTGNTSVSWEDRNLLNSDATTTVDWQTGVLNDSTGTTSIDWERRRLKDTVDNISLDHEDRKLIANDGLTAAIDWTTPETILFSGSLIPTGPYTDNTSSYDLGSPTAAWKDLYVSNGSINLISGSQSASISFTNGALDFGTTPISSPNVITTASVSSNTITFTKGDGSTFPITVNTGSGGGGGSSASQFFVGGSATGLAAGATRYGNVAGTTSESQVRLPISAACTISDLYVRTTATMNANASLQVSVFKNGTITALTLTIAGGSAAGTYSNTSDSATFTAGDGWVLGFINAGSAAAAASSGQSVKITI